MIWALLLRDGPFCSFTESMFECRAAIGSLDNQHYFSLSVPVFGALHRKGSARRCATNLSFAYSSQQRLPG